MKAITFFWIILTLLMTIFAQESIIHITFAIITLVICIEQKFKDYEDKS